MPTPYHWSRMEFTNAEAMELSPAQQVYLLGLIRHAGEQDQYKVEIPLDSGLHISEFINQMLWSQDLCRLKALLRAAFGCAEGEEFTEHNISQAQPPYRLIVYNNFKKKSGDSDF